MATRGSSPAGEVGGGSMPEHGQQQKVKMWLPAAAGEGGHRNSLYIALEILHYCLCIRSSKQSKY
jgi:hypothetical protein